MEQFSQKSNQQIVLTHTQRNNNNCHRFADDLLYKQSCKKDLYVTSNQVGKKKKNRIRMGPMHLGEICKGEKVHGADPHHEKFAGLDRGGWRSLVSTHK